MRQPAIVAIRCGHQLDARDLQRKLRVALALDAGTNQCQLDVVVWGTLLVALA